MKTQRGLLAVALAGALVMAACSDDEPSTTTAAVGPAEVVDDVVEENAEQIDPVQFRRDVRVLWEDHVAWTRLFIVSAVADLPDTDATAARLLQNQADIGEAVAQFYGDEAGAALEALLRDHILIAGDLIASAKTGDDAAVTAKSDAWYANADDISTFLADANPAWPVDTLTDMMRGHLDQTLAEATAQLTGDYEASVTEYDHIATHILSMADTLATGIITQFPDQFAEPSAPDAEVAFNDAVRVLWTDHVAWTRLFIVSAVADLPDTDATAVRLLQNQADIGEAVAQFYGDEAGAALEALLRDHILIAGDLIASAKTGDDDAVTAKSDAWYANADEISTFLADANPAWPVDTLKDMMRGHLDQTLAEATAQLTGDYEASVAEYDHIATHILSMADTLANGIITQFPDQFAG